MEEGGGEEEEKVEAEQGAVGQEEDILEYAQPCLSLHGAGAGTEDRQVGGGHARRRGMLSRWFKPKGPKPAREREARQRHSMLR